MSGGGYTVRTDDLDAYFVAKKPPTVTVDSLDESNRGIAYTTSAFAYLFTRIA